VGDSSAVAAAFGAPATSSAASTSLPIPPTRRSSGRTCATRTRRRGRHSFAAT
jgi:hypothetical protein